MFTQNISKELSQLALTQVTDSIVITTPELNLPGPQIIYVNEAFCSMTGYRADEVIGKTPRILQGEGTNREEVARMRKTLEKGQPFLGEVVNYRKDGTPYYIEWHIAPVRDDNGKIIHWISIQRNITKRKQVEAELKQAKEEVEDIVDQRTKELNEKTKFLNDVLTSVNEGIVVFDTKGTIIECNKHFCDLLNQTKEDIHTQSFPQNFWKDPSIITHTFQNLASGAHAAFEHTMQPKRGSKIPVMITPSVLKNEIGEVYGYLFVVRNITTQKEEEAKRRELHEQVESYAKRLEIKINKLEDKSLALTKNEKQTFIALCENPIAADSFLSNHINTKRSTITAIRNRLKQKKWYDTIMIPDFKTAGYQFIAISCGKVPDEEMQRTFKVMDRRFQSPDVIYLQSSFDTYVSIRLQKTIGTLDPNTIYIPVDATINKFMDVSMCLSHILEIPSVSRKHITPTTNLKDKYKPFVAHLVRFPEHDNKTIAKQLSLSQPTVAKLKAKLISEGYLHPRIIPNTKKLNETLVVINAAGIDEYATTTIRDHVPSFVDIEWSGNIVLIGIVKNFLEVEPRLRDQLTRLHDEGHIAEKPRMVSLSAEKIRFQKLDLAGLEL